MVQCSTLCSAAGVVIVKPILGRHLALARLMVWRLFSFLNNVDARRSRSLFRAMLSALLDIRKRTLHEL